MARCQNITGCVRNNGVLPRLASLPFIMRACRRAHFIDSAPHARKIGRQHANAADCAQPRARPAGNVEDRYCRFTPARAVKIKNGACGGILFGRNPTHMRASGPEENIVLIFKADEAKCRKDGICGKLCPMLIIKENRQKFPEAVENRMPSCIGCGHCVAFCPHGASCLEGLEGLESMTSPDGPAGQDGAGGNLRPLTPEEAATPRIDRSLIPGAEQVSALVRSRRSTRSFAEKPVSREVIAQILRDCDWAPTAKNARALRWIIVNTPGQMRKLGDLMADAADYLAAEEPETDYAELYKRLSSSWRKGLDPFLRGAKQLAVSVTPQSVFAMSDCAIALTYFEMVAHAYGVGCCWAGYFTILSNAYRPLSEFLGLREGELVGGGQMFGYPGIRPSVVPVRARLPIMFME